jgi:hypothetical protein
MLLPTAYRICRLNQLKQDRCGVKMSLANELVILFDLHKSGGITDSEFQTLKARMIRENPKEVAQIMKSQRGGSNMSPLQVGLIAGGSSVGVRLIMDHLKSDQKLRDQVERLETQVGDLQESEIADSQINQTDYQSSEFENDFDFGQ